MSADRKSGIDWEAFDAGLDEHQAREAVLADRRAEIGNRQAVRPDAEPLEIEFRSLKVGDFMTAETGPDARWVEVTKVEHDKRKYGREGALGWVMVTFRTPQPLGVAYEDSWVIERTITDRTTIDASVRNV